MMSTVCEEYTNVVGGDTHARTNTYAVLAAATGIVMDTAMFPTSPPGLARAIAWIGRHGEPGRALVAIEGTNSYGATLTRALRTTALEVCEVRPPRRASRVGKEKSDDIDAMTAARRALTDAQILQISRWRRRPGDDLPARITRAQARRLAVAIHEFQTLLLQNRELLKEIVNTVAPGLMDLPGLGPVTAAQVIVSDSHLGRVRSEAAFAALAGVNPIPASSGNNIRHRLNRHGDRQLNRAVHTIARTRMMFDPQTWDYVERRTPEGRTTREIRRCLERFIARQLFRKLRTLLT